MNTTAARETTAITTRALTIGPQQMLHTVPAGATVRVVGSIHGREVAYIRHSQYGGAVYTRYLREGVSA
jgi:hypothetical protein